MKNLFEIEGTFFIPEMGIFAIYGEIISGEIAKNNYVAYENGQKLTVKSIEFLRKKTTSWISMTFHCRDVEIAQKWKGYFLKGSTIEVFESRGGNGSK